LITAEQARNLAKKRAGEVADARDPVAELEATRAEAATAKLAKVNIVNVVLDNFLREYVRGSDGLRSASQIERWLLPRRQRYRSASRTLRTDRLSPCRLQARKLFRREGPQTQQ
jgi:hypothetical protein